jgi:hypothetical protein
MTTSVITNPRSAITWVLSGFRGARLLRQEDGREAMFTSITFFTSLSAVRGFAGDDCEQAVVEDAARRALSRWDERVSHHEVVPSHDGGLTRAQPAR